MMMMMSGTSDEVEMMMPESSGLSTAEMMMMPEESRSVAATPAVEEEPCFDYVEMHNGPMMATLERAVQHKAPTFALALQMQAMVARASTASWCPYGYVPIYGGYIERVLGGAEAFRMTVRSQLVRAGLESNLETPLNLPSAEVLKRCGYEWVPYNSLEEVLFNTSGDKEWGVPRMVYDKMRSAKPDYSLASFFIAHAGHASSAADDDKDETLLCEIYTDCALAVFVMADRVREDALNGYRPSME